MFFEFNGGARGRGHAELTRQMREMGPVFEYEAQAGEPIYAPASGSGDFTHLLNPNNYQKGAWVLHMLRHVVGDRAFFGGIRDYYASLRDGTAWTVHFERVMEKASPQVAAAWTPHPA